MDIHTYEFGYLMHSTPGTFVNEFEKIISGTVVRSNEYYPSREAISTYLKTKKLADAISKMQQIISVGNYSDKQIARNQRVFDTFSGLVVNKNSKLYGDRIHKTNKYFDYEFDNNIRVRFSPSALDESAKIYYHFIYGLRKRNFKTYRNQYIVESFILKSLEPDHMLVFVFLNTDKSHERYYKQDHITAAAINNIKQTAKIISKLRTDFEKIKSSYGERAKLIPD